MDFKEQEVVRDFSDFITVSVPPGLFGASWKKHVYLNAHGRDAEGVQFDHFVTVRPIDQSTGKRGKVQQGQISKSGCGITSNMELIKLDGHDLTKLSFDESMKLIKDVESEDSKHELVFGIPKTSESATEEKEAHYVRGNLTEAGRKAKEEEKRRKDEKRRLKKEKKALEKKDKEGEEKEDSTGEKKKKKKRNKVKTRNIDLAVTGIWKGLATLPRNATVKDLRKFVAKKSENKRKNVALRLPQLQKATVEASSFESSSAPAPPAIKLDDDTKRLVDDYDCRSGTRVLALFFIGAKEQRRLDRIKAIKEAKERKHMSLKKKLEMKEAQSGKKKVIEEWKLDDQGRRIRSGRMAFADGSVYEGQWVDGKPDGAGVLTKLNGDRYEGEFKSGCMHGKGKYVYADFFIGTECFSGRIYDGEWKEGKYHGKGHLITGDGEVYEGEFHTGKPHGKGTIYLRSGAKYSGNFIRGNRSGFARMEYANGDVYEGNFQAGYYQGEGTLSSPHAGYMQGFWNSGFLKGYGKRVFADGSVYEGQFVKSKRVEGKQVWHPNVYYSGSFVDNMFSGKGEQYFRNGDRYVGGFLKGHFFGEGKVDYGAGGYFEGEFKKMTEPGHYSHDGICPEPNGKRHGKGKRVWADGSTFIGTYVDDYETGHGVYDSPVRGEKYTGKFAFGVREDQNGRCEYTQSTEEALTTPNQFTCPMGFVHDYNIVGRNVPKKEPSTCTYIGSWRNGVWDGSGIFFCCDGRKYSGFFKQGKRHGQGKQTLMPDHERGDPKRLNIGGKGALYRPIRYKGEYREGVREGRGTLIYADKTSVTGMMRRGQPHGICTVQFASGKVRQAIYEFGTRKKWIPLNAAEKSLQILQSKGRRGLAEEKKEVIDSHDIMSAIVGKKGFR